MKIFVALVLAAAGCAAPIDDVGAAVGAASSTGAFYCFGMCRVRRGATPASGSITFAPRPPALTDYTASVTCRFGEDAVVVEPAGLPNEAQIRAACHRSGFAEVTYS